MRLAIRRTMFTLAVSAALLSTVGCPFFVCQKASCPTTGTTTSSVDYVFVTNSASGATYLDGFEISGGSLVSLSGSPYLLNFTPSAMVVSRNNNFLYVASLASTTSSGGIYGYSIGSGGALTALNSGLALENEDSIAMAVSPDGQWLVSLNQNDLTFEIYQMNTSSGLLTNTGLAHSLGNNSNQQVTSSEFPGADLITVAPSGQFIAVAMGLAGFETFSFVTSTGVASTNPQQTVPSSTLVGDFGVAVDSNNNLYVAETNNVYDYAVSSSGTYSSTAVSHMATGTGPFALALDGTSYVYAGSENSASPAVAIITGAATTSGTIGSPSSTIAPTTVSAIAVDSSGDYLVAAGLDASTGIQLYSISSTGALKSIGNVASGTTSGVPVVIAATH